MGGMDTFHLYKKECSDELVYTYSTFYSYCEVMMAILYVHNMHQSTRIHHIHHHIVINTNIVQTKVHSNFAFKIMSSATLRK